MKKYIIEPTMKKSVIEWEVWKKVDEEGKPYFLRRELGWRWGSFSIDVPETEEEIAAFLEEEGYDTVEEFLEVYDSETLEEALLPSEYDDTVDISEDYDSEMIECWDGCWEYFTVGSYAKEISEEEKERIVEEAEAAYEENYNEGLLDLGWEEVDCYWEIDCPVKVTLADADN